MSRAFLICPEPVRGVTAGVGTRFLTLARILAEAGHGVTLAIPNDPAEAAGILEGDILLAIDEANLDMVSRFDAPEVRIYRHGFAAAISAMATAFGIRYASPRTIPAQAANILDLPVQEWREG